MSNLIETFLLKAELGINNALNVEEIKAKLANYGYSDEKLQIGKNLYIDAKAKNQNQEKEYGEQYLASKLADTSRMQADKTYKKNLKLARIVFEDNPAAQKALLLKGNRKKSLSGFLNQTTTFYKNLLSNEEWIAGMSEYNINAPVLESGLAAINKVQSDYESQKKETGEAQKATEIRDKAVDALSDWHSKFIKVARIALEDDPQLLEMLGIVEPEA